MLEELRKRLGIFYSLLDLYKSMEIYSKDSNVQSMNRINYNSGKEDIYLENKEIELSVPIKEENNDKQYINLSEENEKNSENFQKVAPELKVSQTPNEGIREMSSTPMKRTFKKIKFEYNFFEYLCFNLCSLKKKQKIEEKSMILESAENFFDFYMDITNYLKKMIELDFLKRYVVKNENDLKLIENFHPMLKPSYVETYGESIFDLYNYDYKMASISQVIEIIKTSENPNPEILKNLLKYY